MADVAQLAGVTKTTVSMVFRNKPGISEATRQRVSKAAAELNYQYGATGAMYRGQIGLMFLSEATPRLGGQSGGSYLQQIFSGCTAAASEAGTSLLVNEMTLAQLESEVLPPALQRGQVDGMVFRGWFPKQLQALLDQAKVPYMLVDCNREVPGRTQVQIANSSAVDQLVEHVVSQGAAHFATITGDMDHYDEHDHLNAQERHAGLMMALSRRRLALPDDAVVFERGFTEASGRRGIEQLLERGARFDAVICHNDLIAVGAIAALIEAGFRVPGDVRVTGFDNMEFASMCSVPLTTVDPHPHQLGKLAIKRLLRWVHGDGEEDDTLHIKVPAELVVRQSA